MQMPPFKCSRLVMTKKTLRPSLPKNPFTKGLEKSSLIFCEDLPLHALVQPDQGDQLPETAVQALTESRLSYVVGRLETREPLFAISFFDPIASVVPSRQALEEGINFCLFEAHMELLKLGTKSLQKYEETSLLEWIIQRFVAWSKLYSQYCQEYGHDLADIIFDNRFHFPAVRKVAERFLAKGIHTSTILGGLPDRETFNQLSSRLVCQKVGDGEWSTKPHGNRTVEITLSLSVNPNPQSWFLSLSNLQELARSTRSVSATAFGHAGKVKIGSETDELFADQVFFYGLRGADMVTIAKGLATYLCLKDIENWVAQNGSLVQQHLNGG